MFKHPHKTISINDGNVALLTQMFTRALAFYSLFYDQSDLMVLDGRLPVVTFVFQNPHIVQTTLLSMKHIFTMDAAVGWKALRLLSHVEKTQQLKHPLLGQQTRSGSPPEILQHKQNTGFGISFLSLRHVRGRD